MKKTLLIIIIIGLVLLITGKVIMSFNKDDSNIFANNNDIKDENNVDGNKEVILKEYDDVKNIDLELGYYTVEIQEDSEIEKVEIILKKAIIKSNGNDISKVECKNGNLVIYQKQKNNWFFSGVSSLENEKGELLIKIPTKNELNNINISSGVGSIKLKNLSAENLTIDTGTASVDMIGMGVNDCEISGGTGSITINDISVDKIEIESGTGSIFVNGDVKKKADISSGTASVQLELEGKENDYSYNIESGLGKIEINQSTYSKNANINNISGNSEIKIGTGTGSIMIKTK